MRKQTKLVAVLSAAALLAMGASMTSFAAGWQKDDEGTWHYYDKEDDMITDEWKKDGSKWFYLDEDGNMLADQWVDDDYYVGEDGSMLINAWIKTTPNDDSDDPDDNGEHWYYFGNKGKKTVDTNKKINGKTYYFNEDGEMRYGWYGDGGTEVAYYLGEEDDGARKESQWLWLEKSGMNEDDDDDDLEAVLGCTEDDDCDDEGWYWFNSSGKVENGLKKKKINGRYYMFNKHGQMLYEWINNTNVKHGSNAQLDDTDNFPAGKATAGDMFYYNAAEEGWRANGWYQIDGSKDMGTDTDNDWYYVDDGEIKHADLGGTTSKDYATYDDDGAVCVKRIKVEGKYFAFNEKGQMQDGLQYIARDGGFYYFDENGYQKTGKLASVECDDDDYTFYFNTKNGKNGQGYKGVKDDYLYFNGKRLQADDDYRLFLSDDKVYLVNKSGKIQKSKKTYAIENKGLVDKDKVEVTFNGKAVASVDGVEVTKILGDMASSYKAILDKKDNKQAAADFMTADEYKISMPFIQLYDDDVYGYTNFSYDDETKTVKCGDANWFGLNNKGQSSVITK